MSTRYCVPLILLLLGGLVPRPSHAATVNAASCSLSDVQTAINAAAVGDTVHLPTCNQTSWGNTSDSTVEITKRIILEGNGTSATVLHRSAIHADYPATNPMFLCSGATGFEMRNMTLDGTYDTHPNVYRDMGIRIFNCVDFRIHHMAFTNFGAAIQVQHDPLVGRGLIDHNTFTDMRYVDLDPESPQRLGYGVSLNGSGTYPALSLGTAQNLFIEDNTFTRCRHSVGSNNGSRYVARYNTVIRNSGASLSASAFDAHGDTASWPHGSRQYEVYENCIIDSTQQYTGVGPRGGDGVIFNNIMSPQGADGDIALSNDSGCSGTTYPRFDQIRELHIWGNKRHNGSCSAPTVAATIGHDDGCADEIQLGRDYFTTARPGYTPYTYPHPGTGGVSPVADFTTALRMHLKFDEGTLTTAQDSTVNNHDGTLANGATWGAPTMGTSALLLDGVNDEVNVTGLLSSPAAITLAAWVLPTTYGTDGGDVISVGNVIQLRLAPGEVRAHYWNGSTFTVLTGPRATTGQWQHVAVTIAAGAQRLYVNGGLVASASAGAAIGYTGQGSNTFIGTHGNGGTLTRYGGLIDDVRVYTRALSGTDIAGLANLEDPPPLSIQITTPTTNPSYSTSTALLANLGGVASDETGVTGITWNCPTCATTSGPATCTPACGASTEDVNWNIPSITLAPGSNVITVTAADASGTRSDALTVTYTAPPVTGGAACTHWASPNGGGDGSSIGQPFRVVNFWPVATPGKVLCLIDGTYTGGNNLLLVPTSFAGTPSQPITIRALNDGKAIFNGQGSRPVDLQGRWGILEGINAYDGGSSVTFQMRGEHWIARRIVGWNNITATQNHNIAQVSGLAEDTNSQNVLEDCAFWGKGRKALQISQWGLQGNTVRRCWTRYEECPTCGSGNGTVGLEIGYDQRGGLVENNLATWDGALATAPEAPLLLFSTTDVRMFGNIAYLAPGAAFPGGDLLKIYETGGTQGQIHLINTDITLLDNVGVAPGTGKKGFSIGGSLGSGNSATNVVGISNSAGTCGGTSWTCTGTRSATTVAGLLAQYPNPKPATIYDAVPGICKRYIDGVLTNEGLWPGGQWAMNQRISDGLAASGRARVDVTATITGLLGPIPNACKTGASVETCTPPRVGTPPTCSCPAGTVEPNCDPEPPPETCPPDCPVQDVFVIATTGSPGPAGSDAAGRACTLEEPCATINRARALMTPGDTLYLRGGTYTGSANRITTSTGAFPPGNDWTTATKIAGYGGETVVLQQTTGAVMTFNNPATDRYVVLDRLTCDGAATPGNDTQCLVAAGVHHLRLQNSVLRNTHSTALSLSNVAAIEVLSSTIHGSTHSSGASVTGTSDSVLFDGVTFHTNAIHGLNAADSGLTNLTVRNSVGRNNGSTGFQLRAANLRAANLLAYSNALGVRLLSGAADAQLYHLTVADNSGVEVQIDAGVTDTLVTNVLAVGGIVDNGTGTVLTTNYTGDPGFVGTGDYHLALDTSPAADAGTCLPGEVDGALDGIARPQPPGGECDIGAYERAGDEAEEPVPGVLSGRPWRSKMLLLPQ